MKKYGCSSTSVDAPTVASDRRRGFLMYPYSRQRERVAAGSAHPALVSSDCCPLRRARCARTPARRTVLSRVSRIAVICAGSCYRTKQTSSRVMWDTCDQFVEVGHKEFQNLRGIRPAVAKRQRNRRYITCQRATDDRRGEQVLDIRGNQRDTSRRRHQRHDHGRVVDELRRRELDA